MESNDGFSIYSGPDGGLTDGGLPAGGEGSGEEPLAVFDLPGLTGVSYVAKQVLG